jgi:lipoyl(octanoyl) transferase
MRLNICRLGYMDYAKALAIQENLLALRQQNVVEDMLLLVEHPSVLTLGIRGKQSNILASDEELTANGVTIYRVNRGGDVTYHGLGQIVGYPIMDLKKQDRGVKQYVWNVEDVFIRLLSMEFGIVASRGERKYTGVWVDDKKITAIGIAVKHGVTMHGFAFNVNTDLEHFRWINPCGITERGVTSLQDLLGQKIDFDKANDMVAEYFAAVFNAEAYGVNILDLLGGIETGAEK